MTGSNTLIFWIKMGLEAIWYVKEETIKDLGAFPKDWKVVEGGIRAELRPLRR